MAVPLADRMRPKTLDEIVGQRHLFGEGCVLRNIIESGHIPNLIFYGPSGTGKTTVARIIAASAKKRLHILNGTSASLNDVRDVIGEINTIAAPNGLLLYLDEIQYFNKKQQQSLLQYIENGDITLIASTTENPYFYIYSAVLSRSTVFEFKAVEPNDAAVGVRRGFDFLSQENGEHYNPEEGVCEYISEVCGGDMRKALNIVELCMLGAPRGKETGTVPITMETAKAVCARSGMHYDRKGDEYYDMLSAFQKSMRGSDPDAAVHYLARILEAGDLASAARRLLVCANEDVGLAYPMIIPIVMEFEQTYDDMMDDIYQWTYHDSKHESFDVLAWYNKYRRKYFEEEVLPEIQAFRQIKANQLKARLMMRMKQNKKPITETPEPTPATNYKEFPFDDEVPF